MFTLHPTCSAYSKYLLFLVTFPLRSVIFLENRINLQLLLYGDVAYSEEVNNSILKNTIVFLFFSFLI